MLRTLLLFAGLAFVLLSAGCGVLPGDDDDEDERTDRELAVDAIIFTGALEAEAPPQIGDEYDCVVGPGPAGQGQIQPIDAVCIWTSEPQGEQWLVTFRETWLCDDFSADVEGFPPCSEETGFHEWEFLVDLQRSTFQQLDDRGQFAPQQLE